MMVHRPQRPLAVLFFGALCGVSVYVVIFCQINVFTPSHAVDSMVLPQALPHHPPSDLLSNIDHILSQWVDKLKTEDDVKAINDEVVQQISSLLVTRLVSDRQINGSLYTSSPCWKQQRQITSDFPIIYIVTPTYKRPEQVPELIRFAQTLLNVPAIHWIVVEDSNSTSADMNVILERYGIPFTHLSAQMPDKYKKAKVKPRGVANRNAALQWIRKNAKSGVVYFADDDNTYDIRLFEEMRYTKKVSMWPVGLVTKIGLSSPVVKNGRVVDFFDGWAVNRKFPVDMAGFAVNIELLKQRPNVEMPFIPGYEEDGFLKKLGIRKEDIEPKADNCTTILVWHTQTKKNSPANRTLGANKKFKGTNIEQLYKKIV